MTTIEVKTQAALDKALAKVKPGDMMVNVTLDELRLNAIFAALYEREHRLSLELAHLTGQPESKEREFAMDCVAMAIQHSYLTRRDLTIPEPEPDEFAGDHHVYASAS